MKKNTVTVLSIVLGALALIGAAAGVLYVLKQKGILKLKKADYSYEEEFPEDDEGPAPEPAEEPKEEPAEE